MTSTQAGHLVGGRYRLVVELGAGGFGRVWRARDETLDVDVAIKELRLLPGMSPAEQTERLARATREARNAARLRKHENIVAIHDVVDEDGLPWIVMELVDGRSLNEHIEVHGPLPPDRVAALARALLTAIGAAHREGVVHRDLKPANVMIADDGKVLLTDFGTAVHHTDTTLTATGMFIGSPEYMAPERLRGTDGLPDSDLFSLGVTLYQAVEGVSPFHRDSQTATLSAVLLEPPPVPRRAGALAPLITRLMDKDPAARPTVAEALTMLDADSTVRVRERRNTKLLRRQATRRETVVGQPPQRRWQDTGVAALMAILVLFGVAGLAAGYEAGWGPLGDAIGDDAGGLLLALIIVDHLLAGLLFAGMARLVPRGAGPTVAVVVGLFGAAAGFVATAYAVDGITGFLMYVSDDFGYGSDQEVAAGIALAVVTVVVLVGAGWTWESRKLRRAA